LLWGHWSGFWHDKSSKRYSTLVIFDRSCSHLATNMINKTNLPKSAKTNKVHKTPKNNAKKQKNTERYK
jgi:hypothetical protein